MLDEAYLVCGNLLFRRYSDKLTLIAYNALMDFFCAAVPYFLIRRLNIHRREKRNLILLMGGSIL